MNVGIVANSAEKKLTGIGRVTHDTLSELLKLDSQNHYFLTQNGFQDLQLPSICDNEWTLKEFINDDVLSVNTFLNDIDILYSFYPAININTKCKKVLTVHDVIPLIFPQWHNAYDYFDGPLRKSIIEADKIIAMSVSTKKDIIHHYGIDAKKIEVIYSGVQQAVRRENQDVDLYKLYGIKGRYIISVCTVEPRKNLKGLVEAFLEYKRENKDDELQLVLTGKIGWGSEIIQYVLEKNQEKNDIVFTDYVSEEMLGTLFNRAIAVAYVSFYEGFGLPILEGMAAGKAVITSNTSSMPEVGGDAVEYCNPYDKESISAAIRKVVEDDTYRINLGEKAKARAKLFSYKKTATKVLGVLQEVGQC